MTDADWSLTCLIVQTVVAACAGIVAAWLADKLWPHVFVWRGVLR